jgi:hypothetical protein
MRSVAQLFGQLTTDPWRDETGFSVDFNKAQESLFRPNISPAETIQVVNEWLQHNQPCLFGVIGARLGLISYCLLTEKDLEQSDELIANKIQDDRSRWTAEGFEGSKSAFIVLAVSPRIAKATPNRAMQELARRLCSLYLQQEIKTDRIYLDNIFLEKPGRRRTAWMWPTGVNYFCAQGDKRWWQDHRIPGGMAFSVNSVGHMVKSGILAESMKELETLLSSPQEGWAISKVDSLDKALQLAMSTIARASNAVSGKATELLPRLPGDSMICPRSLPTALSDKNCRRYRGHYHTDYTLPSEYFLADVERPVGLTTHTLDFTYLFDRSLDNPDFNVLGEGRRIRSPRVKKDRMATERTQKRLRAAGSSVYISNEDRLLTALARWRT